MQSLVFAWQSPRGPLSSADSGDELLPRVYHGFSIRLTWTICYDSATILLRLDRPLLWMGYLEPANAKPERICIYWLALR